MQIDLPGNQRLPDISFYDRPVAIVARELIGAALLVDGVGGLVVETEAYDQEDPASHSFSGPTPRNAAMFGPPGHAYVYRSYGIHWCLNLVCRPGSAVLIRALEPRQGLHIMKQRRSVEDAKVLCSGPGRLTQALGITIQYNARPLTDPPFDVRLPLQEPPIAVGRRIGIKKAADVPWRFGWQDSPFLSRRF
jgi:DNA-3-methyladenine glycosylase